jgi:alkylhydroperoxidase family enzyme
LSVGGSGKLPIYMFARHLQRRNLETLRFIEAEHARVRAEGFDADFSEEERDMHRWISASADHARTLFRDGAVDTVPPADVKPGSR